MELLTSKGNYSFVLNKMSDQEGVSVMCAPGSGHQVWVDIDNDDAIDEVNLGLLCRILGDEEARIDID